MSRIAYVHTGLFSNAAAEELAETLVGHEPGGLSRAYFCSSGSEGMEAAIKLARQYFLEIGQPAAHRSSSRGGRAITATRSARFPPAAT